MEPKRENINRTRENQPQAVHPLDNMPDFDAERLKDNPRSDAVLDRLFDKIGCNRGEGYFNNPEELANFTRDTLSRTYGESVANFRAQIVDYRATRKEEYKKLAADFYQEIGQHIQDLRQRGLVGDDTINVFLDPNCMSEEQGIFIRKYRAIQADRSRKQGQNWLSGKEAYYKYVASGKKLADYFAENNGDIAYQSEGIDEARNYYTPESRYRGLTFLHVNAEKPQSGKELRCYISADKTKDPSRVLDAWRESMENSPLKNQLYFKFNTTILPIDEQPQRPDDIVIYKFDSIDDRAFKELLQDFQRRCNDVSPELLTSDDTKMPVTTEKIANGISISAEPVFVNKMLRYTGNYSGRHSWTTFVDKMSYLSIAVAANRLGVEPESFDVPGLREETKKVFQEFMLLSKINPDTMLPEEYGDELPSWAKLDETSKNDALANNQVAANNEAHLRSSARMGAVALNCISGDAVSTNLQRQLQAMLNGATNNLDDIKQIMDDLYRVEEELSRAMMQFDQISNAYSNYLTQEQQYLDETWYRSEQQKLDENARMFDAMCKRFLDMEDLLEQARIRIGEN